MKQHTISSIAVLLMVAAAVAVVFSGSSQEKNETSAESTQASTQASTQDVQSSYTEKVAKDYLYRIYGRDVATIGTGSDEIYVMNAEYYDERGWPQIKCITFIRTDDPDPEKVEAYGLELDEDFYKDAYNFLYAVHEEYIDVSDLSEENINLLKQEKQAKEEQGKND